MQAIHTPNLQLRTLIVLALVGGFALLSHMPLHAQANSGSNDASPIRVVQSNPGEIIVEFTADQHEIKPLIDDDGVYSLVTIPGTVLTTEPGKPQAPTLGALFAVPTTAGVTVAVLDSEYQLLEGVRLPPAPQFEFDIGQEIMEDGYLMKSFATDEPVYAEDTDHPSELVVLGETGMMRGQPVTQLQFFPVQTNPVREYTKLYHRIVARITWEEGVLASSTPTSQPSALFEQIYSASLLNYVPTASANFHAAVPYEDGRPSPEQIKIMVKSPGLYQVDAAKIMAELGVSDLAKLTLRAQGKKVPILLQEDGSGLLFYGQPLNSHYADHNVYWLRAEESLPAVMINRTVSATIAPRFSSPQTVIIEEDTDFWQNMRDKDTECKHTDETMNCFKERWFWDGWIGRPDPGYPMVPTSLEYAVGESIIHVDQTVNDMVEVVVHVRGYTRSPHITRIEFLSETGALLPTRAHEWFGQIEDKIQVPIANELLEDVSKVRVTSELSGKDDVRDYILIDRIEIEYVRRHTATSEDSLRLTASRGDKIGLDGFSQIDAITLLDITDTFSPTVLTGYGISDNGIAFVDTGAGARTYLASAPQTIAANCTTDTSVGACYDSVTSWSGLTEAGNQSVVSFILPIDAMQIEGHKYVIITNDKFVSAAESLAAHHSDMGAEVVDLEQIVDSFGFGVESPFAIKRFVEAAVKQWNTEYVVLMGDASLDYRDNIAPGHPAYGVNYVPTFSFESNYFGEIASDNWYGQIDCQPKQCDTYQDVIIGRIPVADPAVASNIVTKTANYPNLDSAPANWQKRVLLVSDDETKFSNVQTEIQGIMPPYDLSNDPHSHGNALRVDAIDFSGVGGDSDQNEVSQVITGLLESGVVLVNYVGHGDLAAWGRWDRAGGSGENKYILHKNDLSTLAPGSPTPFISVGNCLNGAFAGPTNFPAFAEEWLQPADRGAIGVWAPSGIGYPSGHQILLTEFYRQLFVAQKQSVGSATLEAINRLIGQNFFWHELGDMYIFFGDPAIEPAIYNPPFITDIEMTTVDLDTGRPLNINVVGDVPEPLPLDTSITVTFSRELSTTAEIRYGSSVVAVEPSTTTTLFLGGDPLLKPIQPGTHYDVIIRADEDFYDPQTHQIDDQPVYTKTLIILPDAYTFTTMMDDEAPTITLNGRVGQAPILLGVAPQLWFSERMRPIDNLYETNVRLTPAMDVDLDWTDDLRTAVFVTNSEPRLFEQHLFEIGENAFRDIAGNPVSPVNLTFWFEDIEGYDLPHRSFIPFAGR